MKKHRHLLLICIAGLMAMSFKVADSIFEITKNLEIFNSVYKEINQNYVDEVQPGTLIKHGIDAMLKQLDPYTNFYSENQAERALIERQGEYGGVGCRVHIRNSKVVVYEVFKGYAFDKNDVRPGDELIEINGKKLQNPTLDDVSVMLRGSANTVFNMNIMRNGQVLSKTINRMQVQNKSVAFSAMIDKKTAYIKLEEFGREAANEIKTALLELMKDNTVENVVLDLRNNGGGLLNEAVDIVGLFTGKGKFVVDMRGRNTKNNKAWYSTMEAIASTQKLTVLVNKRSASASEVVSGSLQDMDRAVIVGQNSFGKGLVQNYFELPYRTQMKITTAKYYTPSGRCIQLLDYSNRRKDGSVGSIPDSARKTFKTAAGRRVLDGGGVLPDVLLAEFNGLTLWNKLKQNYIVFDFANDYRNKVEELATTQFLTDAEVQQFITNAAEKLSLDLAKEISSKISKDMDNEEIANILLQGSELQQKFKVNIEKQLMLNQSKIKNLLELEIITRYADEAMLYKKMFESDNEILKAIAIMNSSEYTKILKR